MQTERIVLIHLEIPQPEKSYINAILQSIILGLPVLNNLLHFSVAFAIFELLYYAKIPVFVVIAATLRDFEEDF